MEGIASSKEGADAELNQLREQRGAGGNELRDSVLLDSLDQALNLLADQLYQKPTHFLLELIQNADDNAYSNTVVPSLRLSLYTRSGRMYLRTDCNELGFTFKQLDALTRIGQSTKTSTANGQEGYIGEKGIGFKSVFKVADLVHIASGFYEFKLDRKQRVGMLLPILSPFPRADRNESQTQFLLDLNSENDYEDIRQDLENIEPEVLIFLRKLEIIHIRTPYADKTYKCQDSKHDDELGGETMIISERCRDRGTREVTKYVVHRHIVNRLPSESRREGVASSEVVVAFAIKGHNTPIATAQKTFAFLPIDDFGFRFLIHADFLLVASRESLEYNRLWNVALRNGIRDAFISAVRRFARLPVREEGKGMRYAWPKYLSRPSRGPRFWNTLHEDILQTLRQKHVLESWCDDSTLRKPESLLYVPQQYRLEGEPLFDLPLIHQSHLSFYYDSVRQDLVSIGVDTMTIHDLCNELEQWINAVGVTGIGTMGFKSVEWHRKVCSLFCHQQQLKSRLKQLPIIPLQNGSWVSANEGHVFLTSEDKEEHVPVGVNISIVDRDASQDPIRRPFYKFLDIKEYSPRQVCDLIIELHEEFFSNRRSRHPDWVADVAYIFKHRSYFPTGPPRIGFVVMKGGRRIISCTGQFYLIDPALEPNLVSKYRDTAGNPFRILVGDYESVICRQGGQGAAKEFRDWLLRSQHARFATVPIVLDGATLTPEWSFLRNQNVVDLLHAVRFHFGNDAAMPLKAQTSVSRLTLSCLDGVSRTLGLLAVPTEELKQECPNLDFADLPTPELRYWGFLSRFGVITKPCTTARLRELQAMTTRPIDESDSTAIHQIYRALSAAAGSDEDEIRKAFRECPLTFIPEMETQWLHCDSCVWDAPAILKQVIKLKVYYNDCKRLFCDFLNLQPVNTQHVVDELCSVPGDNSMTPERFQGLLSLLKRFDSTKKELDRTQILRIRSASVFPITKAHRENENNFEDVPQIVIQPISDQKWYIADTAVLESAFRGKLDMLCLPAKSVRLLRGLFEKLGCKPMFLSVAIEEDIDTIGMPIRDAAREVDLKIRLRHVLQLSPGNFRLEDSERLRVWSVPGISIIRRLESVETSNYDETILIRDNEEAIDIYYREGTQELDQSENNLELARYFVEKFDIKAEHTLLVNCLLIAPLTQLPRILEKHDISTTEISDVGDDASDTTDQTSESLYSGLGVESGNGDTSQRSYEPIELVSSATATNGRLSTTAPEPTPHPLPLQELIPSYASRVEDIIYQASNFRMADALALSIPTQSHSSENAVHASLSIRTRNVDNSAGTSSSSEQPVPAVNGAHTPDRSSDYSRAHQASFSRPNRSPQQEVESSLSTTNIRTQVVGFYGEHFVYRLLEWQIDDWTYHNWTSRARAKADHPAFTEWEGDYADFTYLDISGQMRNALVKGGVEPDPEWSNDTTFHLEVKTTMGQCEEAFHISQNQLEMMRKFSGDPNNAYILLRVFGMEEGDSVGIKFFSNPWSLYINRMLDFRSVDGYQVKERTNVTVH